MKMFKSKHFRRTEELINKYYDNLEENEQQAQKRLPGEDEFDRQRVYNRILSGISRKKASGRIVGKWQIAASVGILLFLSVLAYINKNDIIDSINPGNIVVKSTANGEIAKLSLNDGTKIWLNAGSKLIYPEKFTGDRREVTLKGEAYFEVAPNAQKPFVIHSGDLTTRVLGTSFNIRAYRENENITVAVVTGKVHVTTGEKNQESSLSLNPHQMAVYNKENKLISRREDTDSDNIAAWKEGKMIYQSTSLTEIVADVQRKYNVVIKADNNIKNCSISVDFNNDSLNKVLKILAELINGKVIHKGAEYQLQGNGC